MPIEHTSAKFSDPRVLLIGAPLVDLIFLVSESFIHSLSGKKGGMEVIDQSQYEYLLLKSGIPEKQTLGGSAANVAKAMATLGSKVAFTGKLGKDSAGAFFEERLADLGIVSHCTKSKMPTGHVFCFVTPDALRTCRSYLGASEAFHISDLHPTIFDNIAIMHLEGYSLLKPGLTEFAIDRAKKKNVLVSFDLGSFEIVEKNKVLLETILPNIDILFGNEEEARSLTGKHAEASCELLKEKVKIVVIFQGEKGCVVGESAHPIFKVPARKVHAVDTTGAGDFFAGAFLHGLLNNCSIKECAEAGTFLAGEIVQVYGTDLCT